LNRPLDDDDLPARGYGQRSDPDHADREISLGTPTILGIFFALALVCACFFGFGYTMGRKSAQSAQTASASDPSLSGSNAPKPTAGSQAGQRTTPTPPSANDAPAPVQTATVPLTPSAPNSTASPSDRIIVGDKPPVAVSQPATNIQQPAGSFVVQVAAVSSQDVADILTSSLQKKGYTVAIRHESQDKLLHVQIGPFADKKEAQAMQARVLADGFNAIVK
jgi:cell division septation protein DedD